MSTDPTLIHWIVYLLAIPLYYFLTRGMKPGKIIPFPEINLEIPWRCARGKLCGIEL